MSIKLKINKKTTTLTPFLKEIKQILLRTTRRINKIVSIKNLDIVIVFYDSSDNVFPEMGIGAFVSTINLIKVSIDSKFPRLKDSLQYNLQRILTHEIYHILRWKYLPGKNNLLRALTTEGLADHFGMEVNNTKPQPWDTTLTPKELREIQPRAESEYFNIDFDYPAWFYGSPEKNIPKWAGYSLGFHLISKYLKNHPGEKASTLFATSADKFR